MQSSLASQRPSYRVLVVPGLRAVSAQEWDSLLEPDDAPLLSWGYLEGLEAAGCVGGGTGWQPAHLLVRRSSDEALVAAAPAYVKYDSDGEWVYDFDWAAFAESQGIAYYPKLVLAVPFNPVGGGRLLCLPGLPADERQALMRLLLSAAKMYCESAQLSSVHVLFPRPSEPILRSLADAGFYLRQQEQYHFLNTCPDSDQAAASKNAQETGRPYRSFDDFLGHLRSHRRTAIRRERRALLDAKITVRTHRGLVLTAGQPSDENAAPGFTRQELDAMFDFYGGTSLRYTGELPYLNRRFFHLLATRLGDKLELVLARDRDGVPLGGAFNLRGTSRLFGRHWGKAATKTERQTHPQAVVDLAKDEPNLGEPNLDKPNLSEQAGSIPFLHFEVCYYHSIERAIAEGFCAFEPGHGGEQKLVRGFTPVLTYSAHYFRDARLARPIAAFLAHEAPLVKAALGAALARCPLRFSGTCNSGPRQIPD